MISCTFVNRYCIQTAVTTLHNQLQSANMSPSMVKQKKQKQISFTKFVSAKFLG